MCTAQSQTHYPSGYRNVLEPLVFAEVERQHKKLAPQLLPFINPVDVLTYALNRLPALYANSDSGWQRQWQKAEKMQQEITTAVHWGLNAVLQDPLRGSASLKPEAK